MNDHIPAEDFAAYIDGMLRPEKKSELENHFSRCPACLDELVEIATIMRSRDKVLAGGQGKIPKSVLHLRLVFEIAAAFVVVVFIGYFFLSNNRFWQSTEQQKPAIVTDKNVPLAEPAAALRNQEVAPLPLQRRDRADADAGQELADASVPPKKENALADKGLPPDSGKSVPISALENKLQESAEKPFRPAAEEENLQKKELHRTATAPEAVGAVQMDFTAKDQTAAKVMKGKAAAAPPPRVRIEGEVSLIDLRNPELFNSWSWFPKGLVLELWIDSTGVVTEVVPVGESDPALDRQAKNEARKLLFSVSKKKSRRARLVANESTPN